MVVVKHILIVLVPKTFQKKLRDVSAIKISEHIYLEYRSTNRFVYTFELGLLVLCSNDKSLED